MERSTKQLIVVVGCALPIIAGLTGAVIIVGERDTPRHSGVAPAHELRAPHGGHADDALTRGRDRP